MSESITPACVGCADCGADLTGLHFQRRLCLDCRTKRARDPLTMKAHAAVAKAIRRGELPRADSLLCVDCGRPACDYDHRDYTKPLQVDAVCRSCNKRRGPALGGVQVRVPPLPPIQPPRSEVALGTCVDRLVRHCGGITELSRRLGGTPVYQEIQRWLARGWVAPAYALELQPLLPEGMTIENLLQDVARLRVATRAKKVAQHDVCVRENAEV